MQKGTWFWNSKRSYPNFEALKLFEYYYYLKASLIIYLQNIIANMLIGQVENLVGQPLQSW